MRCRREQVRHWVRAAPALGGLRNVHLGWASAARARGGSFCFDGSVKPPIYACVVFTQWRGVRAQITLAAAGRTGGWTDGRSVVRSGWLSKRASGVPFLLSPAAAADACGDKTGAAPSAPRIRLCTFVAALVICV